MHRYKIKTAPWFNAFVEAYNGFQAFKQNITALGSFPGMLEAVSTELSTQVLPELDTDLPDLDTDLASGQGKDLAQGEKLTLSQSIANLLTDSKFKQGLAYAKAYLDKQIDNYLDYEVSGLTESDKASVKKWLPKIAGVKNTDRYKGINEDLKYIIKDLSDRVLSTTAATVLGDIVKAVGEDELENKMNLNGFNYEKASTALSKWLLTHNAGEMTENTLKELIAVGKRSDWDGTVSESDMGSPDMKGGFIQTKARAKTEFDELKLVDKTKNTISIILEKELNKKLPPKKVDLLLSLFQFAMKGELEQNGDVVFSEDSITSMAKTFGINVRKLLDELNADDISLSDVLTYANADPANADGLKRLRVIDILANSLVPLIVEGVESLISIGDDEENISDNIRNVLGIESIDTEEEDSNEIKVVEPTQKANRFNFSRSDLDFSTSAPTEGGFSIESNTDAMALTVAEAVIREIGKMQSPSKSNVVQAIFDTFKELHTEQSEGPSEEQPPLATEEDSVEGPNGEKAAAMALPIYAAMRNNQKPGTYVPSKSGSALSKAKALEQTLGIATRDSLILDIVDDVFDENGKSKKKTQAVREYLKAWIIKNDPTLPDKTRKSAISQAIRTNKELSESDIEFQMDKMTLDDFEQLLTVAGLDSEDVAVLLGDPTKPEDDWVANAVNKLSDGIPPITLGNRSRVLLDPTVTLENLKNTVKNLSAQDKLKLSNYEKVRNAIDEIDFTQSGPVKGDVGKLLGFIQNPSHDEMFSLYQTSFPHTYLKDSSPTTPLTLTFKRTGMGKDLGDGESSFNIDYKTSSLPSKIAGETSTAANSRISNTTSESALINQLGKAIDERKLDAILTNVSDVVRNAVQIGLVNLNRLSYVSALAIDRSVWDSKKLAAPKTWDAQYKTVMHLLGVNSQGGLEETVEPTNDTTQIAEANPEKSLGFWLKVAVEKIKDKKEPQVLRSIDIAKVALSFANKAISGSFLKDTEGAEDTEKEADESVSEKNAIVPTSANTDVAMFDKTHSRISELEDLLEQSKQYLSEGYSLIQGNLHTSTGKKSSDEKGLSFDKIAPDPSTARTKFKIAYSLAKDKLDTLDGDTIYKKLEELYNSDLRQNVFQNPSPKKLLELDSALVAKLRKS
jgi:hypothetical protein